MTEASDGGVLEYVVFGQENRLPTERDSVLAEVAEVAVAKGANAPHMNAGPYLSSLLACFSRQKKRWTSVVEANKEGRRRKESLTSGVDKQRGRMESQRNSS